MSDQELGFVLIGVAVGLVLGVLFTTVRDRFQSKGVSREQLQAEFDDYKEQVEAHFSATSKKFHAVTEQYKELYEHLSVGATSLVDSPDARPMFGKSNMDALLDESTPETTQTSKASESENQSGGSGQKVKSESSDVEDAEISEVQDIKEMKQEKAKLSDALEKAETDDAVANIKRNKETGLPETPPRLKSENPNLKH
jgi:uncharacterized membrane-anchored protein YhcB (DUF1043 family)